MPISRRSPNSCRHSCSCSSVYSGKDGSTSISTPFAGARCYKAADFRSLSDETATRCYIVHYAAEKGGFVRETPCLVWYRMAPRRGSREEIWVRERVAFTIMVAILIFLFAFTFAVLGKGEYEPSVPSGGEGGSAPVQSARACADTLGLRPVVRIWLQADLRRN